MSAGHPIMQQELSNRPGNSQEMNSAEMMGNNKQIQITNEPIITKRAGRRKINIEFIEDKSRRHITFSKRKAGIMKKAYELSTLTGTQVLLLVASETGHVYTFATPKLQPLITKPEGKNLIQACLNAPDTSQPQPSQPPSSSRLSSYPNPNAPPPSEPSGQMLYHPSDQSATPSHLQQQQQHLYADEKPKLAGFGGGRGDGKYPPGGDPNLDGYPSSASYSAPPNLMNPMRGVPPYHSAGPLAPPRPGGNYSMGSPSSSSPNPPGGYPSQYSSQPSSQYPMPSMPYHSAPAPFHPSPSNSSPHLYSANSKPGAMPIPHSNSAQPHQMNVGGDYKYLNNGMEGYPYSHR